MPKYTVKLYGMAAGLMNLESGLGTIENDGGDPTGTLGRRKKLHGLFTYARTMIHQVHCLDEFITGSTGLATKRVGVRAGLNLAAGRIDSTGADGRTDIGQLLLDLTAL